MTLREALDRPANAVAATWPDVRPNIDDNHDFATTGNPGIPLRRPSPFDANFADVDRGDNVRCQYDPELGAPGTGGNPARFRAPS
ncbi:hypothetical protein [Dactylosporangium darangshiense]|uniref:hypothetical protein n=1 Tax=Dactylosporangium darangshiense TaxID=579108 RepID=UPI0031E95484